MIRALPISIGLVFLVCQVAIGQLERLKIEGPQEIQAGSLVRLSSNAPEEETPFWIVLHPIDLDYEQVDNGRRLLFCSGCDANTDVTVLLLAQRVRNGRVVTRQVRHTVKVTNQFAGAPDDLPPETPQPELQESPLYRSVLNAWPNVKTDAAKDLSINVADNIQLVAAECTSSEIKAIPDIWEVLSRRNQRTLGIESVAWTPVAEAMQIQFKKLNLKSVEEHAFHLQAAALAIRNAARDRAKPAAINLPRYRSPR